LFKLIRDENYKKDALKYAADEKTTPWMGRDSVNHEISINLLLTRWLP